MKSSGLKYGADVRGRRLILIRAHQQIGPPPPPMPPNPLPPKPEGPKPKSELPEPPLGGAGGGGRLLAPEVEFVAAEAAWRIAAALSEARNALKSAARHAATAVEGTLESDKDSTAELSAED